MQTKQTIPDKAVPFSLLIAICEYRKQTDEAYPLRIGVLET